MRSMSSNLDTFSRDPEDGKILDAKNSASERQIHYRVEWWKSWIRLRR